MADLNDYADLIEHIGTLPKQSARQERMMSLHASRETISPEDSDFLHAMLKAERATRTAKELTAQLRKKELTENGKLRTARTRALIDLGGLIDVAGAAQLDKSIIVGALNQVVRNTDEAVRARLKSAGDQIMAQREAAKQAARDAAKAKEAAKAKAAA